MFSLLEKKENPLKIKIENQSIIPPESLFGLTEHALMIPPFIGKTLMLGWGEGTTAWLYRKIFGNTFPIHGVDLKAPEWPYTLEMTESGNTTHLLADASEYVKTCEEHDIVIVDLYDGNTIPDFVFSDEFIINLRRITQALLIVNCTGYDWLAFKPYDKYFMLDVVKQVNHDKVAFFNPIKLEVQN